MSDRDLKTDPFYSEENLSHLKKSIQQLRDGKGTVHELTDESDEAPDPMPVKSR